MKNVIAFITLFGLATAQWGLAQDKFVEDIIETSAGDLKLTFIGHGTLMFTFGSQTIYVDPVPRVADYTRLPKADLILVTHEHGDHFNSETIHSISTDHTNLVYTETCARQVSGGSVLHNGQIKTVGGLRIEAIPAYNLVHMRAKGQPYHAKGVGNGYVITFGGRRVYVAGDTENTPEMKNLQGIDIAFLPMNLPYTMTPEMVADAVKAFRPKILYPYHFGDTDTSRLLKLLEGEKGIEVRMRPMP